MNVKEFVRITKRGNFVAWVCGDEAQDEQVFWNVAYMEEDNNFDYYLPRKMSGETGVFVYENKIENTINCFVRPAILSEILDFICKMPKHNVPDINNPKKPQLYYFDKFIEMHDKEFRKQSIIEMLRDL